MSNDTITNVILPPFHKDKPALLLLARLYLANQVQTFTKQTETK